MNRDRRAFLQKAARIGGLTAILGLGGSRLVDECLAENIFISGRTASTYGGTSWSTWTGVESGWGDSTNNHIMAVAGGAAANEIGEGMVDGLNLVWSQANNIAATAGGKRYVDCNASQYFTGLQSLVDAVCSDNTWTFAWHLNTVSAPPSADGYILYLTGANYLYVGYPTTGALRLQSNMGGAFVMDTVNTLPNAGDVWVVAWSDGTNIRVGFTAAGSGTIGQPTKLSNFVAGNFNTQAQDSGATGGFNGSKFIYGYGGRSWSSYIYRAVFSKLCLIDNLS